MLLRPITQTSIFARILENIVHVRLLQYYGKCMSKFQLNNKKIFGSICLDMSKAYIPLRRKIRALGPCIGALRWSIDPTF